MEHLTGSLKCNSAVTHINQSQQLVIKQDVYGWKVSSRLHLKPDSPWAEFSILSASWYWFFLSSFLSCLNSASTRCFSRSSVSAQYLPGSAWGCAWCTRRPRQPDGSLASRGKWQTVFPAGAPGSRWLSLPSCTYWTVSGVCLSTWSPKL